jgi:predicted deacetylase
MLPRPAQYLLRFDDLCPTVAAHRWQRFLPLIQEFHLQPILAVVPDNQDHTLQLSPPDPDFWTQMHTMESVGATVALHGYQHLCDNWGRSLLALHRKSEFAGVPEAAQREWIHAGLGILHGHGLNPRVWVAPRHGFDTYTLQALRSEGINLLSDGFARAPFIRDGLTWIPQQLWAPVKKSKGLWTICIHANTAPSLLVEKLHTFLRYHAAQFTSVDRVLEELRPSRLSLPEQLYEALALWRAEASHARNRHRQHRQHR